MGVMKIFLVLLLAWMPQSVFAQRLVSKLSAPEISINSTFTGGSLALFGNVEALIGEDGVIDGPFDIIVVIQGPSTNMLVREKSRQLGIWLNAQTVSYEGIPAYFHTLSTRVIPEIIGETSAADLGVTLSSQIQGIEGQTPQIIAQFTSELKRLMGLSGTFGDNPNAISFHSDTFYSANLELPSNVPNGTYLATTLLFKQGELIDKDAQRFFVRTVGIEKFISNSARDFPALYGIACVVLGLFTGWFGGVVFRRS